MNTSRCKLKIYDEEFEIVVNVSTMIDVEQKTGKGFMDIVQGAEKGSVEAIANLLSSCLRKNNEMVGKNFVGEMEIEIFQELFEPLIECIVKAFPTSSDKKKVEILAMTKR